jgi:succinate dehydrogenase / fumarate reductase, cytochrome b subunit
MPQPDRPLSPHLQIYRPQLTSVLSILHRMTGVGLATGSVLIAWLLFATISGENAFNLFQEFRSSVIGRLMIFCWLWAFTYHMLNGVRHLFWDAGFGFELSTVYKSGWAVAAGSAVFSSLIWLFAG